MSNPALPVAISLMGPTACGKTDLSLLLAESLPMEIVSVDSALVYRDMDIGTAKPDQATLARVPHHLINILDPTERYSAARFRADALRVMEAVWARGRIPLLAGGTMLYFKALKEGLDPLPSADPHLRAQLDDRAAREGWPALHAELARLDPETARRLHATDTQRIQRALEVCLLAGQPMSSLLGRQDTSLPCQLLEIALLPVERRWLHERIACRFDAMLAAGFVAEVRALRARYRLDPELPAMRCVGYRQAWEYLEGQLSYDQFREQGIAATRQLAKRQMTWLRAWKGCEVFDCQRPDLAAAVSAWVSARLAS